MTCHAENGELVYRLQQKIHDMGSPGRGHPIATAGGRRRSGQPRHSNRRSIGRSIYLVHTSRRQALEAITRARNEGQRVYGEVLAGHLLIDDSVYRNPDFEFAAGHAMSPPFRPKGHRTLLWQGLQSGTLQPSPPTTAVSAPTKRRWARTTLGSFPTAPRASRIAWRCSGTTG